MRACYINANDAGHTASPLIVMEELESEKVIVIKKKKKYCDKQIVVEFFISVHYVEHKKEKTEGESIHLQVNTTVRH